MTCPESGALPAAWATHDAVATALARCVQCGLCLAACPAYAASGDEADTPRGRITLLRHAPQSDAPEAAQQPPFGSDCAACAACADACPYGVPLAALAQGEPDARQARLARSRTTRWRAMRWVAGVRRMLGVLRGRRWRMALRVGRALR